MDDLLILGIESSCDETAASVIRNGREVLSNVISSQIALHTQYGGVVPELASRKHIENINTVIEQALTEAGVTLDDLDGIGVTYGPGLVGALLVGVAEAKAIAYAKKLPLIGVNHIEGHVCANLIEHPDLEPPFLCLIVSGGHTHLARMKDYGDFEIIGRTRDDAAGEAFDKCAKVMGMGYPGGPVINRYANEGNPKRFQFAISHLPGLDYSFSGLKTSFLYFVRDNLKENPNFIEENKADLAASLQKTIVDILMDKLKKAVKETGIKQEYFETVVQGMYMVCEAGTGMAAKVPNVQVCGKTGTVQNPHGKDYSVFICFAPKDNPKIAVAVYVENGGFGATYGVPIGALIMEQYINGHLSEASKARANEFENKVIKYGNYSR